MSGRVALAALAAVACSRKDPGFDGVGPWHVGRTTMGEAAVRCDPPRAEDPDLHWCYLNPDLTFAGQQASVDLYFRGQGDLAPLAELLLVISRCKVEDLDRALAQKLGPAPERHGSTYVWKQPTAHIVARMPTADGECHLSFLAPGEGERLAALVAQGSAPPKAP